MSSPTLAASTSVVQLVDLIPGRSTAWWTWRQALGTVTKAPDREWRHRRTSNWYGMRHSMWDEVFFNSFGVGWEFAMQQSAPDMTQKNFIDCALVKLVFGVVD